MDYLAEIEKWYHSNCNEDWEHQFGVTIETLDNPGWWIEIDLEGTNLEKVQFNEISFTKPELDWYHCKVKDNKFIGSGGPQQLNILLKIFIEWAKVKKAL